MRLTTEMFIAKGACSPGLDVFKQRVPSGVWDVTLESCIEHYDYFPWAWLAENMLPEANKRRYLRYIVETRKWYEEEREKLIAPCRLNGGIANPEDIPRMAAIEEGFRHHEAIAFHEATLNENYR